MNSPSLTIREVQIKTTERHHLTLVRIAIIKKKKKSQYVTRVSEDLEKLEPLCTVGGNVKWCSRCGRQDGDFSEN